MSNEQPGSAAAAYAAYEQIRTGQWDRYLHGLHLAIREREHAITHELEDKRAETLRVFAERERAKG